MKSEKEVIGLAYGLLLCSATIRLAAAPSLRELA